ncbi:Hypothetical protein NTJ_06973 [Nesidiocoris tenuis]|uniref:Uncharacterized protein n=1 Tax=Nesidiocoris tenuis TaxID=355587 RepID=A0ABN7APL9_9HEMI|nr:Hypothetical protein NTJ_06973 [Nesidiocoris tenuis]
MVTKVRTRRETAGYQHPDIPPRREWRMQPLPETADELTETAELVLENPPFMVGSLRMNVVMCWTLQVEDVVISN